MGALVTRTSGGSGLIDDQPFSISGTGFGTNTGIGNVAFLGGLTGPIEAATNNANIKTSSTGSGLLGTGWTCNTGFSATGQWCSNTRSYSHTKAIKNRYGYNVATGGTFNASDFQFGFGYDFGTNYGAVYANWIGYLNNAGFTGGQVKFMRWGGSAVMGFQDNDYPNMLFNQFGFAAFQRFYNGGDQGNVSVSGTIYDLNTSWVRYEVMFQPGTGTTDGALGWRVTRLADNSILSSGTATSRQFFLPAAGETGFRWVLPQGYIGNTPFQQDGVEWYYDNEMFFSANLSGTTKPKFLYLGDNPVFASCTRVHIQNPTSWSNTSISGLKINKGGFTSGQTVYWHVMDDINTPNQAGIIAGTWA